MKIAIFHNYMNNIGGAEMVTLTLARELDADIYSTVADEENIRRMGFDVKVKTIGWIPDNAPWRQQLASLRFRLLNLRDKYDFFIISGDWAVSGAVRNKPNLWYVHSPIREIYDLYEYSREHIVPGRILKNINKRIFDVWVHYNRNRNRAHVQHAEIIVANSENTRRRLKTYLTRDAVVIHPPVDTARFRYERTGDYWLSVNRMLGHKRIELQMQAFRELPNEKLVVVGTYEHAVHFLEYRERIERLRPDNVTIRSHVDANELRELYANCRGFITTAQDEDFGITAIEAMASGKPVIAPREGGYRETVIHGTTGVLIEDITYQKLARAITTIGADPASYKEACLARAKEFDTSVFISNMKKVIGI